MKVKRLMSGLFAFAAAALAAAVMSGCSTSPADWSVDVDFTTGTKGTAKVKVQNIDTNNFLSGSDDRLDKLDIYYAYSSEEKIANLKAPSGTQDSGNFSQISVDDVDGKISVTVSDEENAAFKAAPQNSWEKLIDFELPADAAGKEVWFRVVALGFDSVGAGGISGYLLSSNYTKSESEYTKPIAVGTYYQNGDIINFGEGAYINQFNATGSPSRSLSDYHQLNFVKYQRAYGRQYFRFDDDTVVENGLYFNDDASTPMQGDTDTAAIPWGVQVTGGTGTEQDPYQFKVLYTEPSSLVAPAYSVTIPAAVEFTKDGATANITASDLSLNEGQTVAVTLDAASNTQLGPEFNLKNKAGDAGFTYYINGNAKVGDTVAEFTEDGTAEIDFSEPFGTAGAGEYTETLTFGISLGGTVQTTLSINTAELEFIEGLDSPKLLVAEAHTSGTGSTDLEWKSDDETVATVSDDGIVTPVAAGEAVITVSLKEDPNTKLTCNVKVKSQEEAGVKELELIPYINGYYDRNYSKMLKFIEGMTWEDLYDTGWNSNFSLVRAGEDNVIAIYTDTENNKIWFVFSYKNERLVSKDDVITLTNFDTDDVYVLIDEETYDNL